MSRLPVGSPIPSQQVGKVIESKDKDFPVGTIVLSRRGWCDYAKLNPKEEQQKAAKNPLSGIEKALDIGELSSSLLVGACGMPGVTAYWGFLDLCDVGGLCAFKAYLISILTKIKLYYKSWP